MYVNQREALKNLKSLRGDNPYRRNRRMRKDRLITDVRTFCYENKMSRQNADEAILDVFEVLKTMKPYAIKGYGIKDFSFYIELKNGWLVNLIHKK